MAQKPLDRDDRMAAFVGTWTFLIFFMVFVLIWMAMNSIVILWHPADPYPFIFLNLVLSCISAIQAPIILMSQSRQEAKDRLRSQHDYRVNLRAEREIRQLHEKIDHMLSASGSDWRRFRRSSWSHSTSWPGPVRALIPSDPEGSLTAAPCLPTLV